MGGYYFINIPKLGLFEWHPFSISSAERDYVGCSTMHIKAMVCFLVCLCDCPCVCVSVYVCLCCFLFFCFQFFGCEKNCEFAKCEIDGNPEIKIESYQSI